MEIKKKDIGERIKKALNEAGVQQNNLAHMIGLAQSTLSEIINGNRVTSLENLTKIAKALDLSLDYLIIGKERPLKSPQPTKEDALLLAVTSDPETLEKVKDKLRHQIREETPAYNGLSNDEQRLLKAYRLLDARRQERLIDTAEDMSVALSRGFDSNQGEGDCAASNKK